MSPSSRLPTVVVCIFCEVQETGILIVIVSDHANNSRMSSVMIFFLPTGIKFKKDFRRRHSKTFFQDMYYLTNLTKKKCSAVRVNNTEYLDTENWKQKISTPRKNQRLIDAVIIIQYCSIYFFLFLHSIHYPRTTLALTPGSNSDSGSHRRSSSPLPTTIRAFIFIARSIHRFSPSATHVKCYLPTLLSAPSS